MEETIDVPGPAPAFDRAAALDQLDGDEGLLAAIIETYREDAPLQLEALRAAIDAGDAAEARRVAHGLKGASAYVGAEQSRRIARELESAASRADLDDARRRYPALWHAVSAAIDVQRGPAAPTSTGDHIHRGRSE